MWPAWPTVPWSGGVASLTYSILIRSYSQFDLQYLDQGVWPVWPTVPWSGYVASLTYSILIRVCGQFVLQYLDQEVWPVWPTVPWLGSVASLAYSTLIRVCGQFVLQYLDQGVWPVWPAVLWSGGVATLTCSLVRVFGQFEPTVPWLGCVTTLTCSWLGGVASWTYSTLIRVCGQFVLQNLSPGPQLEGVTSCVWKVWYVWMKWREWVYIYKPSRDFHDFSCCWICGSFKPGGLSIKPVNLCRLMAMFLHFVIVIAT